MSNKTSFLAAFKVLQDAYPRWDMTPEAAGTWWELLSDIDPASLRTAAVMLARESKFPPSVADWRERAKAVQGEGRLAHPPAADAWDEMYRNRHSWRFKPVVWSSRAVEAAARMIDWKNPDWLTEQLPTIRAQFTHAYNSLVERKHIEVEVEEAEGLIDMPGSNLFRLPGAKELRS